MATVAVFVVGSVSRPSDAVGNAADWLGIDLSNELHAWVVWVTAPHRADDVASAAALLALLALTVVAARAAQGLRPLGWRGASTAWLSLALYLEVKEDRFTTSWALLAAAIAIWCLYKTKRHDADAVMLAFMDVVFALVYVVVVPVLWSISSSAEDQQGATSR